MARGAKTSDELRVKAQALLMSGETAKDVASKLGLPERTVSDIRRSIGDRLEQVKREKSANLDQLILEYLATGFKALIAQASVLSDVEYLNGQDADKLAIAHGVIADRLSGVAATAQALGIAGNQQSALPEPGTTTYELSGSD